MSRGRPSIYSEELADRICQIVATHPHGLPVLCKMYPDLPGHETINVWRWENKIFSDKYTLAKRMQSEILAESIEDVAHNLKESAWIDDLGITKIDAGMLGHARLVCDNRKWTAARLAPKIYGDQKQIEDLQATNERYRKELQEIKEKLDAKNKKEF